MRSFFDSGAFACFIALLAFSSYFISKSLLPLIIRRAARWGILDIPDLLRKKHSRPIPRFGGLSLAPGLLLGGGSCLLISFIWHSTVLASEHLPKFQSALGGLMIGASTMFILGAIDDFRHIRVRHKLAVQFIASLVVIPFLPVPQLLMGYAVAPMMIRAIYFGWLIVLPNSVNLLDGIDGLTGFLMIAFLSVISIMSIVCGEPGWLLVTVPLVASLISFLRLNWNPARIFMGDSGSLMLGFFVAYLSIYFSITFAAHSSTVRNFEPGIALALSCIWITDTLLAVGRRYFAKFTILPKLYHKRASINYFRIFRDAVANIGKADADHIHHKLLRRGFSVKESVHLMTAAALSTMLSSFLLSYNSRAFWASEWVQPLTTIAMILAASCWVYILSLALNIRRTKQVQLGLQLPAHVLAFPMVFWKPPSASLLQNLNEIPLDSVQNDEFNRSKNARSRLNA